MATENEHSPLKWGETLVYWSCKADIDLLGISIKAVHIHVTLIKYMYSQEWKLATS